MKNEENGEKLKKELTQISKIIYAQVDKKKMI